MMVGDVVPSVRLQTKISSVDLGSLTSGWLLVWCFPCHHHRLTIDSICARSFEDHCLELAALGCQLIGVSGREHADLGRFAAYAGTDFPLLGDPDLALARLMGLPTSGEGVWTSYRRMAFIARDGRVEQVFCSLRPWRYAAQATAWLTRRQS
jgi:peroxiredoxin